MYDNMCLQKFGHPSHGHSPSCPTLVYMSGPACRGNSSCFLIWWLMAVVETRLTFDLALRKISLVSPFTIILWDLPFHALGALDVPSPWLSFVPLHVIFLQVDCVKSGVLSTCFHSMDKMTCKGTKDNQGEGTSRAQGAWKGRSQRMMVNGETRLIFWGQVKVNLVSTTAMSHQIRKQEEFPLHAGPDMYTRVGQEGLWPCEGDQTFADTCYHT